MAAVSWDFETDPEFQAELDWVDDFVRDEVEPVDQVIHHAWDMNDPVRQALIPPLQQQVRERGLWACHLGPHLGGPGYGQVKLALLNEILGRSHSAPIVFGCQAPDSGNAEILAHYGNDDLKKRYLEPLLGAGDRVRLLDDRAARRLRPDRFRHPRRARRRRVGDQRREVVLLARQLRRLPHRPGRHRPRRGTAPADVDVRRRPRHARCRDRPQRRHLRAPRRSRARTATCATRDVRVPADHLLGERGEGFIVAQTRLGGGRIHHAMRTIGLVKSAFDQMCERALSRVTQGETLARKQLVQAMIADSWIQIEQFRLLVLRTAWRIDKWNDYQRVRADISAVKAAMPKVLHDVASRALQIHGSLGVSHEMPFASMVLESFHMGLADGATEVHQITLARELLKGYSPTPELFPTHHLPKLKAEAEARFADVLAAAGRS